MSVPRWAPRESYTRQEQYLLKRLRRHRKLFAFLRDHRLELFDEGFQDELEAMYRGTGAGKAPLPPALLAMATLLQGYAKVSDAEAVELSVVDLRWQMVLDHLGEESPAFSQGALYDFRQRMIRCDMDRRLLERTVELARETKAFDFKKLPKTLRIAVDSAPLEGAGRVEDTFNLIAHAARKVVTCISGMLDWPEDRVAKEAGIPILLASSTKKALDIEWSDPEAKADAVERLASQLDSLEDWIDKKLPTLMPNAPLKEHLDMLRQLRDQDLEPDPSGSGKRRIREGVAKDRRVSVEDPDMRHGRKSSKRRFDGYKRHIVTDLDTTLIFATALTPANQRDDQAAPEIESEMKASGRSVGEFHIDRGYVTAAMVTDLLDRRAKVFCKPWVARNGDLYTKADFKLNLRTKTITCPAGHSESFKLDSIVMFGRDRCARCRQRAKCVKRTGARGRSVRIAPDEQFQQRMRKLIATPKGREQLRRRVPVEHCLAHVVYRQGRRARYLGVRANLFDLRRASAVTNLQTIDRELAKAA